MLHVLSSLKSHKNSLNCIFIKACLTKINLTERNPRVALNFSQFSINPIKVMHRIVVSLPVDPQKHVLIAPRGWHFHLILSRRPVIPVVLDTFEPRLEVGHLLVPRLAKLHRFAVTLLVLAVVGEVVGELPPAPVARLPRDKAALVAHRPIETFEIQ